MKTSEELREALLNLEKARIREEHQRQMAEALLAGLRVLVLTKDPQELFPKLIDVMRKPLDFEEAFILLLNENSTFYVAAGSSQIFKGTEWSLFNMFKRVIGGHPSAIFDTNLVEEWSEQPDIIRQTARSALHFAFNTKVQKAIFVCTHSKKAHFSRNHIELAGRFSVLASQALQILESEEKIANLEEQLDSEAKIAALNKKLAESEKKLSRARKMEAIGLLAGGVAHDLNNILSSIVGYPDLLLTQENLTAEQHKAIQAMQDAGLRATAIIEDLLTVTRGVASQKEPVDLNRIINQFLHSPEYNTLTNSYEGLTINTRLDEDLLNIKASEVHIKKTLMNLISNAVDAVNNRPDSKITISTENCYIDKPLKGYQEIRTGEYAVLSVCDNGTGISSEDIERIFEPFYTRKAMGRSGTGLGLTIVWNTIQDHDGYIDIITCEQGTTILLYFPVTRDPILVKQIDVPIENYTGNGEKILVVDDQKDQREISCAMLTKLGYKTYSVSSGEDAVEYVKNNPVDLIILDMIMDPGINGRETYERILKIKPGQRAIIASGYSQTEDVKIAQQLGAGLYIKKPFTLLKLGMAVKNELQQS